MPRDTVGGTLSVAAILCIVCSVLVSAAAVGLRPQQEANKARFEKKNILIAAGLYEDGADIDELFKNVQIRLIDLETGDDVPEDVASADSYDQLAASKSAETSVAIEADADIAGIKRREKYSKVYLINEGEQLKKIILPVNGKGLWSTLYGFIALEADLNTVAGITFYQHAETPGLGGEVDRESWKASWVGKLLANDSGEMKIEVIKGAVDENNPNAIHQIDGLSGATITSRGVSNLVRYWCGDAFAPFLEKLKAQSSRGANNG
ncbi:MAG: Na(+)-translocating NADH-quinone reductase subunit C [Planctomycetales bacterium]|nr:Na(+)-translocating NADH-quinone reductase subunit C [Planctomycetales bacterium]